MLEIMLLVIGYVTKIPVRGLKPFFMPSTIFNLFKVSVPKILVRGLF